MDYIGATITEHHELIGEARGELRGRIAMLYDMKDSGLLDDSHFQALLAPLQQQLESLEGKGKIEKR